MDQEERERRAQSLINDELLNEAFTLLKEDLMNRWSNSGSTDLEARESIWLAMRLLDRIRGHLTSIVETGQMNKILDKQHPYIRQEEFNYGGYARSPANNGSAVTRATR